MVIVVGGVIEKDGKILLIQEKKEKCYGKYNLPAGRLEEGESIIEGAIREIKEETGFNVEVTGIASIGNRVLGNHPIISIIFSTKIINENILINKEEILNKKWFNIEDILNNMDDELRNIKFIKHAVSNILNNKITPLDILTIDKEVSN